jgi:hypothetical protein
MENASKMPRGEPRPPASWIAELDRLRAENRKLSLELAAARSQHDSCSSVSPPEGLTGGPLC